MDTKVRVRFAPSPTGYLHIGNARTALFNWLFARHNNGAFILRIEDTDVERSSDRYTQSIMEDLRWLGLQWDEGPDTGGEFGPYKQSLRSKIYEEYFQILKKKDLVYPCYCTQEELGQKRQNAARSKEPPRYDNACRHLTDADKNRHESEGRKPVWRFKVPGKTVVVKDVIRGDIAFDASLLGDFIVAKQDGSPMFNFAVCVDDINMKITHIIRGEDHIPNTPRHILLWEAFGYEPPVLAHNTLTLGPDGERLSKRHGAVSVKEYRRLGYLPEGLLNYLALLGCSPAKAAGGNKELFTIKELIAAFTLEGLSSGQSLFNKDKLDWVNSHHIRNMDLNRLTNLCIPYLKKVKLIRSPVNEKEFGLLLKMISIVRGNMVTIAQCAGYMNIFSGDAIVINESDRKEYLTAEYVSSLFGILQKEFSKVDIITRDEVKRIFIFAQKEANIKGKEFYMPVRLALTGQTCGPELLDVLPFIDREKILTRLNISY